MIRSLFFAAGISCLVPAFALCANPKSELQGIKKEIQQKQQLIKTTATIEKKVSGELAQIDKTLREKEDSLKSLTVQLKNVETSISKTIAEANVVQREVALKKEEIRKRI